MLSSVTGVESVADAEVSDWCGGQWLVLWSVTGAEVRDWC